MAATPEDAIRAYTISQRRSSTCRSCGGRWPRWTTGCRRKPRTLLYPASRRLLDRAARWLLTRRPQPLDVLGEIARYAAAGRPT